MKTKINNGIRILFGISLVIFGADKFLEFIPHGHEMTDDLMNAFMGLIANKFILPTVGIIELIVGILLILNRFANLALIAMVPVSFGIVAFHLAVDINGMALGALVALLNIYLIIQRKDELICLIKP